MSALDLRRTLPARAALPAWCVCMALVVAAVALHGVNLGSGAGLVSPIGSNLVFALWAVAYASVGAVIGARRAENPIGWMLLAAGFVLAASGRRLRVRRLRPCRRPLGAGLGRRGVDRVLHLADGARARRARRAATSRTGRRARRVAEGEVASGCDHRGAHDRHRPLPGAARHRGQPGAEPARPRRPRRGRQRGAGRGVDAARAELHGRRLR